MRLINKEIYKITITYGTHNNAKGILLRLYNTTQKNYLTETFISFDKIEIYISRMCIYNSIPRNTDLHYIKTIDDFLEKIFIYHCTAYIEDTGLTLGILTRSLGVCSNRTYEFEFLKTQCVIDFLLLKEGNITLFIYNKLNDSISLQIDVVLDEQSFKMLFTEIDIKTVSINETIAINYKFTSEKHLSKNGVIPYILLKIQEILKHKTNDINLKLETLSYKFAKNIYKIQIENELKNIDFFILEYETMYKWIIDYYTLKKIESKYMFFI